jgi:hypothetical protein
LKLDGVELHEVDPKILAEWVARVVAVESPVHKMEVMKRITEAAGLQRTGARIQATIQAAIDVAHRQRRLRLSDDFLWDPGMKEPRVRDRRNLDGNGKKLDLVAPEEIQLALVSEIRRGFSMTVDDAMASAARALGFLRVTDQARQVLHEQLRSLLENGKLKNSDASLAVA